MAPARQDTVRRQNLLAPAVAILRTRSLDARLEKRRCRGEATVSRSLGSRSSGTFGARKAAPSHIVLRSAVFQGRTAMGGGVAPRAGSPEATKAPTGGAPAGHVRRGGRGGGRRRRLRRLQACATRRGKRGGRRQAPALRETANGRRASPTEQPAGVGTPALQNG